MSVSRESVVSSETVSRNRFNKRRVAGVSKTLLYVVLSILFLFPFLWTLSTSFKTEGQLFVLPPQLIPHPFTLVSYVNLFRQFPFVTFLKNSVIISVLSSGGAALSCAMVAYSFARLQWPGRDILFIVLISTLMLPPQVTMVPVYLIFRNLHMVNTLTPVWLPYWVAPPFYVFLLRQFFLSIPADLEEAAVIDGAGVVGRLFHIMLPLVKPALLTVVLFSFMNSWNDFLTPLIYISKENMYPVSLGLQFLNSIGNAMMQGGQGFWAVLMAASVIAALPLAILFFIFQRQFVEGIVMGGVKG